MQRILCCKCIVLDIVTFFPVGACIKITTAKEKYAETYIVWTIWCRILWKTGSLANTIKYHWICNYITYFRFQNHFDEGGINAKNTRYSDFQQHAGHDVPCNLGWIEQELVAGSHTVKVQWALGSGTYLNNNPASDYLGGSIWSRQLRVIAFYH